METGCASIPRARHPVQAPPNQTPGKAYGLDTAPAPVDSAHMPAAAQSDTVTRKRHGKPGNPNWTKGVSGNPGGKRQIPATLMELAKAKTERALSVIVSAMEHRDAPWPTKVRAAEIVLEYGHGKPAITVDPGAAEALAAGSISLLAALQSMSSPQPVVSAPLIDVTPQGVTEPDAGK